MDPASSCSDPERPLVLAVDDSATMRRSIEMSLTLGGYRVVLAKDGAEAIALLRGGLKPALVLTDIVMPGVDGLHLIAAARKLLRFTPIVALTTQGQRAMREQGQAAGATAWLTKPTGGRELLELVARFTAPPQALPADDVMLG